MIRAGAAILLLAVLTACQGGVEDADRPAGARDFPKAFRPVSTVVSNEFSDEDERDNLGEAKVVMDLARIAAGTSVADIGAGEGYYTVRLSERVGPRGRVLAQDIDAGVIQRLGQRVERERLDNVSIKLGASEDPRLPERSFDRVFMVHMYHEVTEPYAFLWNLRPSLKPGGRVVVVDIDRPADQHGIPPQLLFCEFGAVGFRLVEFVVKPELNGYYAAFETAGPRPAPKDITPCDAAAGKSGT